MAQRVRDILLRITGDASDAQSDLHDLARELVKFDGTVAEATVDVDTTPAQRKVEAARKAVQDFGRLAEEAKVDLQTRAAEVKLDRLRTNLENLQKKPVSPKIDLAIGKTVAQIERVEAQLDKLDRRRVNIDVDVGRGVGGVLAAGVGAAAGAFTVATQGLGLFISAASTGIPVIGGVARLLLQMGISGAALGPMFLVLIPIMVAAAAAVTLLGGAVVALGASFLAAAAGVGVLGVALAAAFGPVLLVAIAAMSRFAKILQAVKASEDGAAAGAERVRDASQAQVAAQRNAADAAARVKTTAVDAYRAWAQAAEDASDAIRGITQAELSRDQARLNTKRAEQDLKDLLKQAGLTGDALDGMFKKFTDVNADTSGLASAIKKAGVGRGGGPSSLDIQQGFLNVRQARADEADAIDAVGDAQTRANEAREREQEFIQQGIAAYEPYNAALQASADAQLAVAAAAEATADARAKQAEATKELTPQERRLVEVIKDLKTTLTNVFAPATRRVFEGLLNLLEDLADFAKDKRVRDGLADIGGAIGGMLTELGKILRSRSFRDAFATFMAGGAKILRELRPLMRPLVNLITTLAERAMPWLLEVIGDIGARIRGWLGDAKGSKIQDFVDGVRESFGKWKRIALELWGIVVAFFEGAKGPGDDLATTIGDILEDFRLWLQENPDKIRSFFEAAAWFAKALADALDRVVTSVKYINEHPVVISPVTGVAANTDVFKNIWNAITGNIKVPTRQHGGVIPGTGTGDIVPAMLEPGEFVIRRSVAQAIGIPRLNLLNAGGLAAARGGGRGSYTHIENLNLPAAPGHDQMGDARHQAIMFAREMARRGGTPVTR